MIMNDPAYVPDRRPIASRNHPLSVRIAGRLAAWRISPNAISVAGMLAGLLAGGAFAASGETPYGRPALLAAALLMQLRLLANMFDGMVAVQTARASPVGELFNEVPDRVSDAAIFVGAGYALGSRPELGYVAAIVALFTAYVRAEGKVAGAHQEFCGPMAKPQRMAVMTGAALYAAFAPLAWQPRLDSNLSTLAVALLLVVAGGAYTSVRRLARIAQALKKVRT